MGQSTTKQYVTFFSPGSFIDETREVYLDLPPDAPPASTVRRALELSARVRERYGARPYAFQIATYDEPAPIKRAGRVYRTDRSEISRSGRYFIDGVVLTLAEVAERAHREPSRWAILLSNMRDNGWSRVVETQSPYRHVAPFLPGDAVVHSETGAIIAVAE